VTLRLVLVDPRPLVREAVSEALSLEEGIEVAATGGSAREGGLQVGRVEPDVVVLSTALGAALVEACTHARASCHQARTLVLDSRSDEASLLEAVSGGADGYVGGEVGLAGLVDAIRGCARGETVVPPHLLGPLLRRLIQRDREASQVEQQIRQLTPREREVLSLLVGGATAGDIAARLVVSPETVRTHLQRVLRKLEVHSQADAVSLIVRAGMAEELRR
jgi:DNA-binding NarL/FixJ family response regulator